MIIKVNGYELNITKNQDVYVGGNNFGQIFINWDDLDENEITIMENIEAKALNLIMQSGNALTSTRPPKN